MLQKYKKYLTPKCKECPVRNFCTARASGGREIDRSDFAKAVAANNQRYQENGALYRKRQEINEYILGTIKRQWGYNYTNLIGLKKVDGEHALIMLVYNIKRSMNNLAMPSLIEKLLTFKHPYLKDSLVLIFRAYFKPKYSLSFFAAKIAA